MLAWSLFINASEYMSTFVFVQVNYYIHNGLGNKKTKSSRSKITLTRICNNNYFPLMSVVMKCRSTYFLSDIFLYLEQTTILFLKLLGIKLYYYAGLGINIYINIHNYAMYGSY